MKDSLEKILVLGATGKTGSRVLSRLSQKGIAARAGSRKATIPFDWDSSVNWSDVLKGIETVYISFQPDLAVPGAPETIKKFCQFAKLAGTTKLVLLSGRGEPEAVSCEEVVMSSGLRWSIVRASWFNQNFSESFFLDPILTGELYLPVGNVREPFIDADDIADVVVECLLEPKTNNRLYEVTGPRLLSFPEALQEISQAIGRPIQFHQITVDDYVSSLRGLEIPEPVIGLLVYLFSQVLDGRNESLSHGVEEALGRKPKDFREYIKETAASGVWQKTLSSAH